MTLRFLSSFVLGVVAGDLCGFFSYFSASLIKVALLIIAVSIIFKFVCKTDPYLNRFILCVLFFCGAFIFGTVRSHIEASSESSYSNSVKIKGQIQDVLIKDNNKIINVKILESVDGLLVGKNSVLYLGGNNNVKPGDEITAEGKITDQTLVLPRVEDNANKFSTFNFGRYWESKGVSYTMFYPAIENIRPADSKSIKSIAFNFRDSLSTQYKKIMDNTSAGILMAMLLGDESNISKETRSVFNDAGISHILVLSGYNIVMVAVFAGVIFRKMGRNKKIILTFMTVGVFLLMAQLGSSAIRAAIMALYAMMAAFASKESDGRLALWGAAFVFVMMSPYISIYDISFHLSFLATASIIYFYPIIQDFLQLGHENKDQKVGQYLSDLLIVTFSANILVLPYLIYQFAHFNIFSYVISVISTAFVPLIMLFGFIAGLLSFIYSPLASVVAYIPDIFIRSIIWLADVLNDMQIKINISLLGLVFIYLLIVMLYFFIKTASNIRKHSD